MKHLIFILIALICCSSFSQNLTKRDVKKLRKFNIEVSNLDINNKELLFDLKTLLKKDRKRKLNKTVGVVLVSISGLLVVSGVGSLIKSSKTEPQTCMPESVIGGLVTGVGSVGVGISIPFLISAKKRKKERNILIAKYKNIF